MLKKCGQSASFAIKHTCRVRWCAALLALCVAGVTGEAGAAVEAIKEGAPLVKAQGFELFGEEASKVAELKRVKDGDGAAVYRVNTHGKPSSRWSIQLHSPTLGAVKKGDVLFASFDARSVQSMVGDASLEFIFEKSSDNFEKSTAFSTTVGLEWTTVHVPFKAASDLDAGEAHATFRLGYPGQVIELRNIAVVNLGPGYPIESLPATPRTYEGMSLDAPWRKDAQKRIERHRMAELTVRVRDAQGRAVPGAAVDVEMTRSAFGFGSAVVAKVIASEDPADAIYKKIIEENFNEVVFENDLKWNFNNGDFSNVDIAMDWLESRNIAVRGHCLVWPAWNRTPKKLKDLSDAGDLDGMRAFIKDNISGVVGRYAGRLIDWDVINEVYKNHAVVDVLGEEAMVEWFKLAQEADPAAKLYINDYGILTAGGTDEKHQSAYEKTIRYLIDNGAPIHGIGFQGHFAQTFTPPDQLKVVLDRYAATGLRLKVTEFDISTDDEDLQAAYARDFLTMMYSHPSVDAVVMWGFWEKRHWRPNAAWWRADWSPKPAVAAFRNLIHNQWWTRAAGQTDTNGGYATRAHLGEYAVTVTLPDGTLHTQAATLAGGGSELIIKLP